MLENVYACAFCQESFNIANSLVSHVKAKHRVISYAAKENDLEGSSHEKSQKEAKTKIENKNDDFDPNIKNEGFDPKIKNEDDKKANKVRKEDFE